MSQYSLKNLPDYGWGLVAVFILLQPFHNWFELPIALMAIIGVLKFLKEPQAIINMPAFKPLIILFACIWLPMVFSLTDAVNFQRSAETTLSFLRFPLAGIFVLCTVATEKPGRSLNTLLGWVLSFCALDVIIQSLVGHDLFWILPVDGRMTGVIGHRLVIGHILAVLSPIYFYWIWKSGHQKKWLWPLAAIYSAAVLLSGARVAWIMLFVGIFLILIQLFFVEKKQFNWKTIATCLLIWIAIIGGVLQQSTMHAKIENTSKLFSGNFKETNEATSLRLPIWKVATMVFQDHKVNGIGPRGFRDIYPQYVPKDDYWLSFDPLHGPTHPHQLLLEIMVETGTIGLLGYVVALGYWIRLVLLSAKQRLSGALPWMSAVIIAIMPINAHMAFYASFWSCVTWWLIAISLAFWQASLNKESATA